jgi:hypothetical protein
MLLCPTCMVELHIAEREDVEIDYCTQKSLSARSRLPHHVDALRASDSRERIGMRSGVPRESTAAATHGLESCLTLVSPYPRGPAQPFASSLTTTAA